MSATRAAARREERDREAQPAGEDRAAERAGKPGFPAGAIAGTLALLAALLALSHWMGAVVMAPGEWLALDQAVYARVNALPFTPLTNVLFMSLNSPGVDYLLLIAVLFGYTAWREKDRLWWVTAAAVLALSLNVVATWEVQRAAAPLAKDPGQAWRERPFTTVHRAVTPVQACGGLDVVAMRGAGTEVVPCDQPPADGRVQGQDWRTVWERYPSFPSGHMREVAALGVLIVVVWRAALPVVLAYGLVMAFSRVLLGAHYPTDVLGGTAMGLLSVGATLAALHAARRVWEWAYGWPLVRSVYAWVSQRDAPAPRAFRTVLAIAGLHLLLVAVCVVGASPGLKNVYEVAEDAGRWSGTHVVSVLDGSTQPEADGDRSRAALLHALLAPSLALYGVLGVSVVLLTLRRGRREAVLGGLTLLLAAVLAFELHLLGEAFLDRPEAFSERAARAVPESFRAAWDAVDGLPNLHTLLLGAWAAAVGAAVRYAGIPAQVYAAAAAFTAVNVGASPFPDAISGYLLGNAAFATACYALKQLLGAGTRRDE